MSGKVLKCGGDTARILSLAARWRRAIGFYFLATLTRAFRWDPEQLWTFGEVKVSALVGDPTPISSSLKS